MPCSSLCLSQIWLLGNTEHRSKLANSCSPGSGRKGLEENHHATFVFYASEKQTKFFLLFLTITFVFAWTHPKILMTVGVLQLSPHSASLPFCLRLWSPWTWPEPLCLQFLFSQVHPASCCQTNHPKTCFFTGHFPCQRNHSRSPFATRWNSNLALNTPQNEHLSIFPSFSLFWISPSNQRCSFIFPFIQLFIY